LHSTKLLGTVQQTARVRDCLALKYPLQFVRDNRYFAQVDVELGLCIYCLEAGPHKEFHAQLYPIPRAPSSKNLQDCFISFMMTLAGLSGVEFKALRKQYRYSFADNLLILQCLIHEAHDHWRATHAMENRDADAGTGEGLV
jgi:hypothetical protein